MKMKSDNYWREREDNGRAVEERINALLARDRAAIHRVEKDKGNLYPVNTLELLRSNIPHLTAGKYNPIGKFDLHLLSASQLPSPQSGKAIIPHYDNEPPGEEVCYLFNMDETARHPALVMRAFALNGNTGEKTSNKNFHIGSMFDSQEMADFYEPFSELPGSHIRRETALINAVRKDPTLSGQQMDMMTRVHKRGCEGHLIQHNELLIAATPRNIEAIVIPLRKDEHYFYSPEMMEAVSRLSGALSGLEHARNGIIRPVMLYHIYPPHQGKCTYVAQGEEECKAAAVNALKALEKIGRSNLRTITPITRNHCIRLMGIDPHEPVEGQLSVLPGATMRYKQ